MTALPRTIVLDTNLVISAFILPQSLAAQALEVALIHYDVVYSRETILELALVLERSKFDRYIDRALRQSLLHDYAESGREIIVESIVTDCRDPRDDKFLALARDSRASMIVTGDKRDLLSMDPYGDIRIIGLRHFVENHKK
jgi:uncharacterized protein